MAGRALSGVRVLDLTQHVAGPYCTKLFADFGADVIKIERPGQGDVTRHIGPFLHDEPHPDKSGLFLHLNTNKRSITLNLKSETGKAIFKDLVKNTDIVIEGFKPGTMERLGLSYSTLETINPKVVMLSISNFGQTGPYRDFKASEIVEYAMGGPMITTGIPDREPVKLAGTVSLTQAGTVAATATMTAFLMAGTTGEGEYIDFAIFEAMLGTHDRRLPNLGAYAYSGADSPRSLPGGGSYPSGTYVCEDGYVVFLAFPNMWPRFPQMVEMPELLTDPRFATLEARARNRAELDDIFVPWCLTRTKHEVFMAAQKANIPGMPVNDPADLLNDPHFKAREYFIEIEHPVAGKLTYPGAPVKMGATPWEIRRPAPLLGQHNQEIYGELGYSNEDLTKLRETGVI